ncbi:toll/interleukin-1 receptor domain-containing protein [Frankia sp. RB7]|nr:toll/interleukin-1 receptor domain-containing protein [Frankia sp. RB7]
MAAVTGQIFLSHASEDKAFVEKIYARLDVSSAFYDIRSIEPGEATLDAMEHGVRNSSIFVLFHSPHSQKTWVNFEKNLARLNVIENTQAKILVCPIDGESYKTLPAWMQRYMTTTPQYRVNDIARNILYLQRQSIAEKVKEVFVGREDLSRRVELDILSAPTQVGAPIQHLLLTGIPGMGRSTFAREIIRDSFPAMRHAGPFFDLPDMADAVDIHLRLKEDLDGTMSKEEIERQIAAFQTLETDKQALTILKSLGHWAELNQVVVLRTRWGLRDRARNLKPWLNSLFRQSNQVRNLRIIYVSERRLAAEALADLPNVRQYEIGELSEQNIQYILSKKTDSRYFNIEAANAISKKVRGHPATAHYVAYLTNSGKSFDSINLNPEPIYAFQDKTLEAIFSSGLLEPLQKNILTALGWFPKLPLTLLSELMSQPDHKQIIDNVWDLLDYSLIELGEGGYYRTPEVVSARIRRDSNVELTTLFARARALIEKKMNDGQLGADLIDALIIAAVNVSIALLECAIAIEYGVSELLPETVELALAAGRQYDAWQLQSRQAIKQRNWTEALELLSKIERKDFFDLQLESRALQIKREDVDIARDPVALKEIDERLQQILIATYQTPEGYREA